MDYAELAAYLNANAMANSSFYERKFNTKANYLKLDDPKLIQDSTADEKRASPRHLVDRNGESISDAQRRTRNTKPSFFESQVYGSC